VPYVTRPLSEAGAVVELLIGVNEARRGALAKNHFPVPERIRVRAQVDTGSGFSAIDLDVLRRLDLRPINTVRVRTPSPTDQPQTFEQYAVSIALASDDLEMFVESVEVLGCAFAAEEGSQAMLGRDVLEHCLFLYDGQNGTFSLAF
jgi:hypothetical protein